MAQATFIYKFSLYDLLTFIQPYSMRFSLFIFTVFLMSACGQDADRADAYGNFEATTVIVSAESAGRLLFLHAEEGEQLKENQLIALVDTTQLHLQRKQAEATIGTLPKKLRNAIDDIEVLEYQKANLARERDRVSRLVEQKAATPKQLDDLNGELKVVDQRIAAIRTSTNTSNRAILSEKEPLLAQVALIREQIRRSYVYNPIDGVVLTRLTEPSEMVSPGAPLYRIGQLDTLTVRAYAGSVQLQSVSIGQTVEVLIDSGKEDYQSLSGEVSWISAQAEFTPKVIQTKEERTNLVYAIKVRVPNPDGRLKIGMPAEVNFTEKSAN